MFLNKPPEDEGVRALYASERADEGFVMNLVHLWAWRPEVFRTFVELRKLVVEQSSLTAREYAVLVCATASSLGDSYCSLAWGHRLAEASSDETAAALLASGKTDGLSPREAALAHWAKLVVNNPNATSGPDVDELRANGLSDREIFEATAWIALRLAFSTVNDALGAQPDAELAARVPAAVREAVKYGRTVAREPSVGSSPDDDN